MAGEVEHSTKILLHFVVCKEMAAEEQSDKMVSDMEVCMKQRGRIEFLHAQKKIAFIIIHLLLMNIHRNQTLSVSSEAVDGVY